MAFLARLSSWYYGETAPAEKSWDQYQSELMDYEKKHHDADRSDQDELKLLVYNWNATYAAAANYLQTNPDKNSPEHEKFLATQKELINAADIAAKVAAPFPAAVHIQKKNIRQKIRKAAKKIQILPTIQSASDLEKLEAENEAKKPLLDSVTEEKVSSSDATLEEILREADAQSRPNPTLQSIESKRAARKLMWANEEKISASASIQESPKKPEFFKLKKPEPIRSTDEESQRKMQVLEISEPPPKNTGKGCCSCTCTPPIISKFWPRRKLDQQRDDGLLDKQLKDDFRYTAF